MIISLKSATLHVGVFAGGSNLQTKLEVAHRTGLILEYDQEQRELLVEYKDERIIVPIENVVFMVPISSTVKPVPQVVEKSDVSTTQKEPSVVTYTGTTPVPVHVGAVAQGEPVRVIGPGFVGHTTNVTAQVSTPQDHVFGKPGRGKKRN